MKRNTLIIVLVLVTFAVGLVAFKSDSNIDKSSTSPTPIVEEESQIVLLILDYGEERSEYEYELLDSSTVLGVLEDVTKENGIELETTYYEDFDSTLVNAIGGFENNQELSWIYFVNGNAGDVGADQKEILPGDLVEWKYVEPIY